MGLSDETFFLIKHPHLSPSFFLQKTAKYSFYTFNTVLIIIKSIQRSQTLGKPDLRVLISLSGKVEFVYPIVNMHLAK